MNVITNNNYNKKRPWTWKRERRGIFDSLAREKEREKLYNYIIISESKNQLILKV